MLLGDAAAQGAAAWDAAGRGCSVILHAPAGFAKCDWFSRVLLCRVWLHGVLLRRVLVEGAAQ